MSEQYLPTYIDNVDNSISIVDSSDSISYYKTENKINTLSAKNIAHKKTGEDLNLCAFDGSNFNPVITINNNNSDCRIMTNLNVSGNLNVNSTGFINLPVGTTTSRPNNPNPGTIRYNSETYNFEGYSGFGGGTWLNLTTLPLYTFTSHTFTNCGQQGRDGPTLSSMYDTYSGITWVNNTEFFNSLQQGYQIWTVPKTGNYQIKAYGAKGGNGASTQNMMGLGAWTQGNFSLTLGTKITIIVGQKGSSSQTGYSWGGGGGGGATWVLLDEGGGGHLYCVAGGGGGEKDCNQDNTLVNQDHSNGGTTHSTNPVMNWTLNQSETGYSYGGGGGSYGIKGGAQSSGSGVNAWGGGPYDGASIGGTDGSSTGHGGFGGGGGATYQEAGGGGGYVGGDANNMNTAPELGAEGGSSRNNGSSISFGNHTNNNGSVEITFIS